MYLPAAGYYSYLLSCFGVNVIINMMKEINGFKHKYQQ